MNRYKLNYHIFLSFVKFVQVMFMSHNYASLCIYRMYYVVHCTCIHVYNVMYCMSTETFIMRNISSVTVTCARIILIFICARERSNSRARAPQLLRQTVARVIYHKIAIDIPHFVRSSLHFREPKIVATGRDAATINGDHPSDDVSTSK